MNLNPFARRRRSLTPRGDVLQRLDENGKPASDPESPSTGSNWPVVGWIAVSRKGANIVARGSRMPSSMPSMPLVVDPETGATRLGSQNREVIAGMQHVPEPPIVPKPEADHCPRCHHPVGHTSWCPHWSFLNPEAFPDD